ncbi:MULTISPECIES: hypothetical protein [Bradyrhizobium]|nr:MULTISPECIES: hypothetical protein [Bradyrhizobium]SFV18835.1 hypothetical protein SAMN05192541_14121 [Bradyrhizobium arachidis]
MVAETWLHSFFQKPPTIGGMRLNTGAHSWKEVLSAVLRIVKVMLIK